MIETAFGYLLSALVLVGLAVAWQGVQRESRRLRLVSLPLILIGLVGWVLLAANLIIIRSS